MHKRYWDGLLRVGASYELLNFGDLSGWRMSI
jgi:homoserine trans-succinylase